MALAADGAVLNAGWTIGVDETARWVEQAAGAGDALVFVDAPLIVTNPAGTQRACERIVGRRYGRWRVSANSTNVASPRRAGQALRALLEASGWGYQDGHSGPPGGGRVVCECYPYTTIVGTPALGYDRERPLYKRKPRAMSTAAFRRVRAEACDELIARVAQLGDPPLDLASHPATRELVDEPSPLRDADYKRREDLLDAVLAAWTARLWLRYGRQRCQILGPPDPTGRAATIIAPCRPQQRGGEPRDQPTT